ncbi:hypothetical protein CONCODRAFT_3575 [Conidiobolus coronatus NRRL 28638]|uniref:rRNA methyltransferase 1, mitochondrial n=1 Tax=Conidiobolus coronatus (strain ATCC 28846 / CBS 209.66 / NRRL 28638) TaxID=796925 RepID=A0A137PEN5_CONC2|nr:hypothetical protein CONCODRAFT_3575 [Conidiobolus coronatus NRRL 28638]|eukprot:KXN73474.1 hypothetical protein CONCODRAFT_3575 [Conidiobolus coronatus NRRL 28638]
MLRLVNKPSILTKSSTINSRFIQSKSKTNEWIYGYNPVKATLSQNPKNRKLVRLLLVEDFPSERRLAKEVLLIREKRKDINELAKKYNLNVEYCSKISINNFTEGNPNQGILLEASKINLESITGLSKVESDKAYHCQLNNKNITGKQLKPKKSSPVWLVLNNITDPHNVGSIIRSAYFFGIDGIILDINNSPSLNSTVSKSSSGALDLINIYSTNNLKKFLKNCKTNGWNIVGTGVSEGKECEDVNKMERQGIQENLISALDSMIYIPIAESGDSGLVDSLNVGVATGVLLNHLSKINN